MTTKFSFGCSLFNPNIGDFPDYSPNLDGYLEPDDGGGSDPGDPTGPQDYDNNFPTTDEGGIRFGSTVPGGVGPNGGFPTLGGGTGGGAQCTLWKCATLCNSCISEVTSCGLATNPNYYTNRDNCDNYCLNTGSITRWKCETPGSPCVSQVFNCGDATGDYIYTSQTQCETNCQIPTVTKYSCNLTTGNCESNEYPINNIPPGVYDTLELCQSNCIQGQIVTGFKCRAYNATQDLNNTGINGALPPSDQITNGAGNVFAGECPGLLYGQTFGQPNPPYPQYWYDVVGVDPGPDVVNYFNFWSQTGGQLNGFGTSFPTDRSVCIKTKGCFYTSEIIPIGANQVDYGIYATKDDCEKASSPYGCRDDIAIGGVGRTVQYTNPITTTGTNDPLIACYFCNANTNIAPKSGGEVLPGGNTTWEASNVLEYPCAPYTLGNDNFCYCKYTVRGKCTLRYVLSVTSCNGVIVGGPGNAAYIGIPSNTNQNTACPPNYCAPVSTFGINGCNFALTQNYLFGQSYNLRQAPQSSTEVPNLDYTLSFFRKNPAPFLSNQVHNSKYLNIFGEKVHFTVDYYLKRARLNRDWDSSLVHDLTLINIEASLNKKFRRQISIIKDSTNKPVPYTKFLSLVRTKLIEGTLNDIDTDYIRSLAEQDTTKKLIPIKTSDKGKNISNALSFIEQTMVPLEASNASYQYLSSFAPLIKSLATDVEKALPIVVSGVETKYYIDDNDEVIARSGLKVEDGDYVIITASGVQTRIYLKSEKDHAYAINNFEKAVALDLLDGDPRTYLTVSSQFSANVEVSYDLSALRENFYILKLNTDSIQTDRLSSYIDKTTAKYDLMGTTTTAELRAISNYIKYKANNKAFGISYDDLLIDHMLNTSSVTLSQQDIRSDGHSRKTNKSFPILVRQIPWYIIIIPTNKHENNTFQQRSKLISMNRNGVVRTLGFNLPINKKIFNPDNLVLNYNLINKTYLGEETDIYNQYNPLGFKLTLTTSSTLLTDNYKDSTKVARTRKTGLRVAYEILTELNNNYVLDKGVNDFDLFSRMRLDQYTEFRSLVNTTLFKEISGGLFGPKVYSSVRSSPLSFFNKTGLVKRRASAPATDNYTQIKTTNEQRYIIPPTNTDPPIPDAVSKLEPL